MSMMFAQFRNRLQKVQNAVVASAWPRFIDRIHHEINLHIVATLQGAEPDQTQWAHLDVYYDEWRKGQEGRTTLIENQAKDITEELVEGIRTLNNTLRRSTLPVGVINGSNREQRNFQPNGQHIYRGNNARQERLRNMKCYNCGRLGHLARDCRGSRGGFNRRSYNGYDNYGARSTQQYGATANRTGDFNRPNRGSNRNFVRCVQCEHEPEQWRSERCSDVRGCGGGGHDNEVDAYQQHCAYSTRNNDQRDRDNVVNSCHRHVRHSYSNTQQDRLNCRDPALP